MNWFGISRLLTHFSICRPFGFGRAHPIGDGGGGRRRRRRRSC